MTLGVQYARHKLYYGKPAGASSVAQVVEKHIQKELKGAKVLDVTWTESTAKVGYKYDRLYDVTVTYEKDGKIKKFVAHYGVSKGVWIVPKTSELMILDDKAEVVHEKSKR